MYGAVLKGKCVSKSFLFFAINQISVKIKLAWDHRKKKALNSFIVANISSLLEINFYVAQVEGNYVWLKIVILEVKYVCSIINRFSPTCSIQTKKNVQILLQNNIK